MNRLYGQVGVRLAAVGLLLAGAAGGVRLERDREAQQQGAEVNLVVAADAAEIDLLRERQAAHAAARASQRKAEADAAAKASREAKAAATKARKLAKTVLKKKAAEAAAAKAAEASAADDGPSRPFTGPIPESCNEYRGNRKIGCAILIGKGFELSQMPCLDKLWQKESGWNVRAANRSSGAYGIPQAFPGRKMASVGSDWRTSAATQIKWGLGYIEGRYNTPCGAWSHSQRVGWY